MTAGTAQGLVVWGTKLNTPTSPHKASLSQGEKASAFWADVLTRSSLPSFRIPTCAPKPSVPSLPVYVHLVWFVLISISSRCSHSVSLALLSTILYSSASHAVFLGPHMSTSDFLGSSLFSVSPRAGLFPPPHSFLFNFRNTESILGAQFNFSPPLDPSSDS